MKSIYQDEAFANYWNEQVGDESLIGVGLFCLGPSPSRLSRGNVTMHDSIEEQAFYEEVPIAFGFLSDYGFSLHKGEFGRYVAKSDKCYIEISLDWDGININLGPNKVDSSQFQIQPRIIELSYILPNLNQSAPKEPPPTRSTFGAQQIVSEVHRRAELLRHYCVPLLMGDFSDWHKVEEWVQAWMEEKFPPRKDEKDEKHLQIIKSMAERSWQEKKYDAVVFLYRPIREYLTGDEMKRLEYAYRQLSGDNSKR